MMKNWTESERDRRKLVEAGLAVVANTKLDHNLIAWAKENGCYVYIGRPGRWGNPFRITERCPRELCIEKHREWFATRTERHARLDELRGKVLGCFCHPEACHGDEFVKRVNDNKES